MNYTQWKETIVESCKQAGTFQPCYENVINTLAEILERKDIASQQFKEEGGKITIEYTNKAGATNIVTNPLIKVINDLDKNALVYWRELGLTPLRTKKASTSGASSKLQDFLAELERQTETEPQG